MGEMKYNLPTLEEIAERFDCPAELIRAAIQPGLTLQIEDADVLVLAHPGVLDQQTRENMHGIMREQLGIKCIILEGGLKVDSLIKAEKVSDDRYNRTEDRKKARGLRGVT